MANLDRVNPKLVEVIRAAAKQFPGYDVKFKSGYRPGDKRQHGKGKAVDVTLIDKTTGKAVPDYQNAKSFGLYEKFAQTVRSVQQQIAPEITPDLRWGGYFSGKPGKYGALDLMHFDLAGRKIGMAGGSWEKGLSKEQSKIWGIGRNMGMGELLNPSRLPSAGPIPPSRPAAPLSNFTPAPVGRVERMALPSITKPAPQPAVAPAKQAAAYQQYAASRTAAPQAPVAPPSIDPKILGAYQQYAQSRMAAPTEPVAALSPMPDFPAPVMPTPPAVRLQPVPPPPALAPAQSYPEPPKPPSLTPMDVWNGSPGTAMATGGNQVSGDAFGNVAVTNKFGATTINNARGNQASGSLIAGPLGGGPEAPSGMPSVPSTFGQKAKTGFGTVGGAALGSFGGPIGSIIGALLGRELAKPGAGAIGGLINGTKTFDTSNVGSVLGMNFGPTTAFAKPQSGLAFPDAPAGGIKDARFSNRSYEGMRDISPKAAKDISKGKGGLF